MEIHNFARSDTDYFSIGTKRRDSMANLVWANTYIFGT